MIWLTDWFYSVIYVEFGCLRRKRDVLVFTMSCSTFDFINVYPLNFFAFWGSATKVVNLKFFINQCFNVILVDKPNSELIKDTVYV